MTKEQKIKEAWGEHYEVFKEFISENGWVDFKKAYGDRGLMLSFKNIPLEVMDNYDPKYCYWKRPFSLSGIENNNGWIKIEIDNDLPDEFFKEPLFEVGHFTETSFHQKQNGFTAVAVKWFWNKKLITHYKPIEKSNPPVY